MKEIIDLAWNYRARWRFIGIQLGIDLDTLVTIEGDNKKAEACLSELISLWLRGTNPRPTRSSMMKALQSQCVAGNALAISKGILHVLSIIYISDLTANRIAEALCI